MNLHPIISKHYVYVGKGWYIAKHSYSIAMEAVYNQSVKEARELKYRALKLKIGTLSPVKYNGSFVDTFPQ